MLLLFAPACSFAAAIALALASAHAEEPQKRADVLPIRRVLLPPERVAAEMERARLGALKQLSLADFEALVRRANRAVVALQEAPQLLEARFRARLEENDLVGSAEWNVHNPGPAARLLPFEPFNLALRKQPRLENRDAFVGDFDGNKLGLLLDESGRRSLVFDWSSRGEASPDGLRFDLQLPSCAIATLDLYLPVDRAVAVSALGCTVSGPLAAEKTDERLWRIGLAGRSPIDLRIRRLEQPGQASALLTARLESKQHLTPDGLEAEYLLQLRAMHQEVRELECDCDPALRPYEVVAPGLEKWELKPQAAGSPTRLTIHLREPLRTGFVTIRAVAPLPSGEKPEDAWISPGVRLLHGVLLGERLLVRVHPDVSFEDWRAGHFRLQESALESDGTRALTLIGGGLDLSPPGRPEVPRPHARIHAMSSLLQARQLAWWQVQAEKSSLTCQITYEALRGRVFQLPLDLPAGWRVESVEVSSPTGLLRGWEERPERGVSTLIVDLQRPLTPRRVPTEVKSLAAIHSVRVTVRLTAAGPKEWAFPDVIPRGVSQREGALAISFDEQLYRARVEANTTPAEPAEREEGGSWGSQLPDYYYRYYGEPVRGTLRLQPREPRVTMRCTSEVVLASGRAALITHVRLQPEVGSPDTLDLLISAPLGGKWEWRTTQGNANPFRAFEPARHTQVAQQLTMFAADTPLSAALCASIAADFIAKPRNWRLTLTRPLREPVHLDFSCEVAPTSAGRWELPLLAVAPPHHSEGEVTLYLAGADLVRVESDGLQEAGAAVAATPGLAGSPWRTFRYGALPASLVLHGQPATADPGNAVIIDRAVLATYVEPSGRLLHRYRFHLGNWKQRTLPLRLPAQASMLAARVDGHWITQTPPPSLIEGRSLIELPVPAFVGGGSVQTWHRFEVVFAEEESLWRLATMLQTPPSILPVAPLNLRRIWYLPPGVVPVFESRCRCLPAANHDRSPDEGLPFPLSGGWPPFAHWPLIGDTDAEQRRRMTEAATALATNRAGVRTLGDLLDRLASEPPAEPPLVLDADAFQRAGMCADTPLRAPASSDSPLWEDAGLVYVPARAAPLLTTRSEWEAWREARQEAGRSETTLAGSLEEAIGEAVAKDHDGSGRFRTATDWLRDQGRKLDKPAPDSGDAAKLELEFLRAESWTAWEPIAGTEADRTLLVARRNVLSTLGPVLAVLLCLAFWGLHDHLGRWRLGLLLLWLAVGGLGYLWLPATLRVLAWWPLLAASAVALACYLATAARKQPAAAPPTSPRTGAAPIVITGVLLAIGSSWWIIESRSNADDAATEPTVFLIPAPEADKWNVLAPPKLLEQLDAQARRTDAPRSGCVLVSAAYDGKLAGDGVQFKAEYLIYALDDGAAVLSLPLDGVQLDGETLLDGARIYPTAARPPGTGYTVRIEKRSPPLHRLSLRFRVPVDAAGEERDAQWTLPPVAQNRLTLELPKGTHSPRALAGQTPVPVRGAQRVVGLGDGSRLEADLGRVSAPFHLHWLQEGAPSQPAQVQVREAYLWDLRPDLTTLTALLRYNINQGAISSLALDIPERLDVLNVEVPSLPGRAVQLKDWRVTGQAAARRLEVEFQSAVTGEVTAVVQLAPRRPFASGDELPLPVPHAAQSIGGLLACQVTNLEVHPQARGLTVHDREQFAALWRAAGRIDPRLPWQPALAFTFQRGGGAAPQLQLAVRLAAAPVQALQQITWRVGPDFADFQAACTLKASDNEVTLVEWDVPPEVTIIRVDGRHVLSWSQTGRRLQAWFDGPRRSAELQLAGWVKPAVPPVAGQAAPREFQLPCLQLLDAPAPQTWLRLISSSGLTLKSVQNKDLLPLPDLGPNAEQEFYTQQPRYSGTFRLVQTQAAADARVLTVAEVRGSQVLYTALVDYHVRQGDPHSITVELRNWPGNDAQVEAVDGVARLQPGGADGVRTWTVELQPGGSGRYRFSLKMSHPQHQPPRGVPMPNVALPGVAHVERWLAVAGSSDLLAESTQGLEPVADAGRALGSWAEPLRRTAQTVWRVTADDWKLDLRQRTITSAPPVQVFLADHETAVADGRRWVYQTTFWLYHEANIDLMCRLPENAQLLAVALDDSALTPLQPEAGRLWIPLPGSAGSRRLRLRWTYRDGAERLEHPRLLAPHLAGIDDWRSLWTVHVPSGYEPASGKGQTSSDSKTATASECDLCRAEAQLQLSTLLANKIRPGDEAPIAALAAAQQCFYRACRYAELASSVQSDTPTRLSALREQNQQLARQHGFETIRAEAERHARLYRRATDGAAAGDNPAPAGGTIPPALAVRSDLWWGDTLPGRGAPLHWQSQSGGLVPRLTLVPMSAKDVGRTWSASVLLLVLLGSAWVLAQFPGLRSGVRVFWPEQVALLGCLMWQTFGSSLLVVFLVLLGVCARLVQLVQIVLLRFRRSTPPVESGSI